MIDLDFNKIRGEQFCPLMNDICVDGSTKKMRGRKCVAWRELPLYNHKTEMTKEVSACSVYEWPPQLQYEIAGNVAKNQASTDKVATNVINHHKSFIKAIELTAKRKHLENAKDGIERLSHPAKDIGGSGDNADGS